MSPRHDPHLAIAARWAKDPLAPGARTILALTCRECRELLDASRFKRDPQTKSLARTCFLCKSRTRRAVPSIRAREYRMKAIIAVSLNAESRDMAVRHGNTWTGVDLEFALRPDLTAVEAAAALGRTVSAVKNVRHRAKTDPRYIAAAGATEGSNR